MQEHLGSRKYMGSREYVGSQEHVVHKIMWVHTYAQMRTAKKREQWSDMIRQFDDKGDTFLFSNLYVFKCMLLFYYSINIYLHIRD